MPEINVIDIKIENGIHVTVPAQLNLMTTFILYEQGDWFEDEIAFLRQYVKPGMYIIDIGANLGVYALSLAKIVGRTGKLWAFEPTPQTASCLARSIKINNFDNIELIQAGVSNKSGKAKLYTSRNSEHNTINQEISKSDQFETIDLVTLDQCEKQFEWTNIDFIKIDAEGEERNILEKAGDLLSHTSPLIMYELKHGKILNVPLINQFANMGYDSYRLIPKLNILVPFEPHKSFDNFLLNLFCCKTDKARQLEKEGFLVAKVGSSYPQDSVLAKSYLSARPYTKQTSIMDIVDSEEYYRIIAGYLLALSDSTMPTDKIAYLMGALEKIRDAYNANETRLHRLATYARIAIDGGERELGVNILSRFIDHQQSALQEEINEYCLPAHERYDSIDPQGNLQDWLLSSVLEKLIEKHAFSLYFSGSKALPLLQKLNTLGFADEAMQKRYQLVKQVFPQKGP